MRVLLDENLDHALRHLLGPHQVVTAAYMGWGGLKNGDLLRVAEENGIEVLVTGDQTLSLEQKLTGKRLAVVALPPLNCRSSRLAFAKLSQQLTTPRRDRFSWSNAEPLAGRGQVTTES